MKKALVTLSDSSGVYGTIDFDLVASPIPGLYKTQVWEKVDTLLDSENIFDAARMAERISNTATDSGQQIASLFAYKQYPIWWIHYDQIFHNVCLPFTKYSRLIEKLSPYDHIYLIDIPHDALLKAYFESHGKKVFVKSSRHRLSMIPVGSLVQFVLTLFSLPVMAVKKSPVMVYGSDIFGKDGDYDFRLKHLYEELRARKIRFQEYIRTIEGTPVILQRFKQRRRGVVYVEAALLTARLIVFFLGKRFFKKIPIPRLLNKRDNENWEKTIAFQVYESIDVDIWAIRLLQTLLCITGVRTAFFTSGASRTFHALIAAKLNGIKTVGILHGYACRSYNVYDFMPNFKGIKSISVDRYGVWSDWWKEYYEANSKVFSSGQLVVSGPLFLHPDPATESRQEIQNNTNIKILFISEVVAVPEQVIPFFEALLSDSRMRVSLKCRAMNDCFESWLKVNRPDLYSQIQDSVIKSSMSEAVLSNDIVVGSQSTGVIEATMYQKPFVAFYTQKWGDYFELRNYRNGLFFAQSPDELISKVHATKSISTIWIQELAHRFFGNPYKNGSKWVVDTLIELQNK